MNTLKFPTWLCINVTSPIWIIFMQGGQCEKKQYFCTSDIKIDMEDLSFAALNLWRLKISI